MRNRLATEKNSDATEDVLKQDDKLTSTPVLPVLPVLPEIAHRLADYKEPGSNVFVNN
jgi:hypothetical protein